MAKRDLHNFLTKLDKELDRSSQDYRRQNANKRAHLFRFNSSKLAKELKIQIEGYDIPLSNKDKAFINKASSKLKNSLEKKLRGIKAENKKLWIGSNTIRMTFTSSTKVYSKFGDPDSIYHKVYSAYRPLLKKYFATIQEYLHTQEFINQNTGRTKTKSIKTKTGKVREAAGKEIQLGHTAGGSVIESFIRDAFEDVIASSNKYTESGDALSEPDIRKQMSDLGVDITIIKDARLDSYTVELEAGRSNRDDGIQLKARKATLQRQIKKAIKKLGGIENLKGSDTLRQKYIKKTRQEILEPFKGLKNVVVISKSTKTDSTSNTASRDSKAKIQRARRSSSSLGRTALPAALKKRRQSKQRAAASRSPASSPLQMITQFNAMLPQTVAKNMQSPALNLQTGRLASSARVTDIAQTPQGFPSIGYTYDNNYRTFEVGNKQGSIERDPRKLIDGSIREIAVQMAMTRFYTRRV
jgi:hypothetical protein|tara:strand:- start:302 stop:1708 length:1407 start_codon:yes stop_codon:yes gene_type:complete